MENPIAITLLNDFVFCPASIYFHMLDADTEKMTYQTSYQLNGAAAHEKSDASEYSDRKNVLQAISVYSEKYNLEGKIDIYDSRSGILAERKRMIHHVYDGYIFQLYAQYYALTEMGYTISKICLYSMTDNKVYPVKLPEKDPEMFHKFENTIDTLRNYTLRDFKQENIEKCRRCIYEPLCSYSSL